jgi:hypothetical protein
MRLPDASFAEISTWALGTAHELRAAANVAEIWGARVGSPSMAATTALLGDDAVMAGQLSELFRALIPH